MQINTRRGRRQCCTLHCRPACPGEEWQSRGRVQHVFAFQIPGERVRRSYIPAAVTRMAFYIILTSASDGVAESAPRPADRDSLPGASAKVCSYRRH